MITTTPNDNATASAINASATAADVTASAITASSITENKKRKAQEAFNEAVSVKNAMVARIDFLIAEKRQAQTDVNAAISKKEVTLAKLNAAMDLFTDACGAVVQCKADLVVATSYEPTSVDYVPTSPTYRSPGADSDSDESVASPRVDANGAPRCKAIKWPLGIVY